MIGMDTAFRTVIIFSWLIASITKSESALILKSADVLEEEQDTRLRNYFGEGSEGTYSCALIDVSMCGLQDCLLGFEKNEHGCVVSCKCAKEGILEGDIVVKAQDLPAMNYLYGLIQEPRGAAIASGTIKRWNQRDGSGNVIIPYAFDGSIMGKPVFKKVIQKAIDHLSQSTCIRLVPVSSQGDFLSFKFGPGCFTSIGRKGGKQDVTLGQNCLNMGSFVHEIMHTLGFYHEQSRPDRDNYVKVIVKNILPDMMSQIRKMTNKDIDSLGSPYDIGSVMQYGGFSFSRNGRPTILNIRTMKAVRAQRSGLSAEDVTQIKKMYGC